MGDRLEGAAGLEPRRPTWRDWIAYLLARTAICIIQTMTLRQCDRLARLLAGLVYDVLRIRRGVIDENLACAFPDATDAARRAMARRMWHHLFLLVCEVAHAPRKLHPFSYNRRIRFGDRRLLVDYLLQKRPVVLVSGHFGNFELSGWVAGMLGFPIHSIARRLDNPLLDAWVRRFREAHGQFVLDKEGCAQEVAALLESGGTLGILGDQYGGNRGLWIEFLGRPASCFKATALFTLTSGAPQLVTAMRRAEKPLHFELDVLGVADPALGGAHLANVKTLTQWYHDRLADCIRGCPEQYWWVHRRWKGKPQPRRRRRRGPAAA